MLLENKSKGAAVKLADFGLAIEVDGDKPGKFGKICQLHSAPIFAVNFSGRIPTNELVRVVTQGFLAPGDL